jgi:DNA helicase II / ATP-dependent DNA helicase PcrA
MDYLDTLNPSQRAAVEQIKGPIMVIAGAGSGKTRVLTYRIAHMMKQGVDPFNIMALTFTNKAAKEMNDRISSIVGSTEARSITMGTFHSVFSRILRQNAARIGYPQNFTIYDTSDTKSLLKDIIKSMNLDDKIYKPAMVYNRISTAKNNLITPDAYAENQDILMDDAASAKPDIFKIYKAYDSRCFKAGAMDFDDLLFKTNLLLYNFPDVLSYYQHKFQYILVDEYQDTNYAQYLIIKQLAAVNENLCVVGDDAQSIYSFRGANIQNILNFKSDYPDNLVFKLEQNYRSTKAIVEAANSVIAKNKDQIQKEVWTDNERGQNINIIRTSSDNEEGRMVANAIFDKRHEEARQYSDFAILYRTNSQSRSFEESLRKLNLPYKIYGGLSFYQRKEIKDIIAYFRLTANQNDEEALKRVINYPRRGIGQSTIEQITITAAQYEVSLWDVISNQNKFPVSIAPGARVKIDQFVQTIRSYAAQLTTATAHDLASEIAKTSGILKELYDDKTPEGVGHYENIQALLAGIQEFTIEQLKQENSDRGSTLADFMIDVALLTDADNDKEEDKNKITLMTIHASKGLEFPHVHLVGLEENLFPSMMVLNSREDLEEERRLFYVALTRAEKMCTISYATTRFKFGNIQTCEPSRFIDEIDHNYVTLQGSVSKGGGRSLMAGGMARPMGSNSFGQASRIATKSSPTTNVPSNLKPVSQIKNTSSAGSENLHLKVGYNVMHDRFGKGKVIGLQGEKQDQKAIIFFPNVGQKTIMLKFAKLEILE